jgi:hypothetical protein
MRPMRLAPPAPARRIVSTGAGGHRSGATLEVDAEGITVPREAVPKLYSCAQLSSTVIPGSRQ